MFGLLFPCSQFSHFCGIITFIFKATTKMIRNYTPKYIYTYIFISYKMYDKVFCYPYWAIKKNIKYLSTWHIYFVYVPNTILCFVLPSNKFFKLKKNEKTPKKKFPNNFFLLSLFFPNTLYLFFIFFLFSLFPSCFSFFFPPTNTKIWYQVF